jgi:hypothetical protein
VGVGYDIGQHGLAHCAGLLCSLLLLPLQDGERPEAHAIPGGIPHSFLSEPPSFPLHQSSDEGFGLLYGLFGMVARPVRYSTHPFKRLCSVSSYHIHL